MEVQTCEILCFNKTAHQIIYLARKTVQRISFLNTLIEWVYWGGMVQLYDNSFIDQLIRSAANAAH